MEAGLQVTVVAPASGDQPSRTFHRDGAELHFVAHDQRFLGPRLLRPWRKAALPYVHAAEPDVVHGQGIITGGIVAAAVSAHPTVVTARGNARRDTLAAYGRVSGPMRAAIGERLIDHVLDNVDLVVDVHPDWRVNLPRRPRRFVHIPNIVDDAFFSVEREPIRGRVLFCGGNRRIKGFDLLEAVWPEVLKQVPGASLRLVGWPEGESVDVEADMTGSIGVHELATELAEAHVVVVPSRYEVSPILLAEAWAVGTPVVASAAGGMASLAPGAAVVVPVESPDELGRAVVDVLRGTVDTEPLVAAGRRLAAAHRDDSVVAAHLALYNELAEGS